MKNKYFLVLCLGDIIVLALVTFAGFATHGEAGSGETRMLTTFVPLVLSWLMVAPFLGVYDLQRVKDVRQLWRPFYAMVLAGPLASWMRAVLLRNAPIIPVFVVVLGGASALALAAWRGLYWLVVFRKR